MALQTRYDGLISSDIANAETTDGVLIIDLMREADDFMAEYNRYRNAIVSFMGYVTTNPDADRVTQVRTRWMRFSEHGLPDSKTRFEYDIAVTTGIEGFATGTGFTSFARDVVPNSAGLIRRVIRSIAESNQYFRYMNMWKQFFTNVPRNSADILTKATHTVKPFYYGTGDNQVPPPVGTKTFSANHNHFLRSATTAVITVADVDTLYRHVVEHGFDSQPIIFGDETAVDQIMALGEAYVAKIYVSNPLIPNDAVNANQAGALSTIGLPMNSLFTVVGVWRGKAYIAIAKDVPAGYLGCTSHEGPLSPDNALQVREPQLPSLRGIRRAGKTDYPFVEMFWEDFVGFGVRQRGNGACMQYVYTGANTDPYVVPTWTEVLF
jgi:hypothetical protein